MRKTLDGSRIERGRKNRKNMRKQVIRKAAMLAQTMRRRTLLTGGSGGLSTMGPLGFGPGFVVEGGLDSAEAGGATPALPAEGGALLCSADLSGLTWLSTCKPPAKGICNAGWAALAYFTSGLHTSANSRERIIEIPAMQGLLSAN